MEVSSNPSQTHVFKVLSFLFHLLRMSQMFLIWC